VASAASSDIPSSVVIVVSVMVMKAPSGVGEEDLASRAQQLPLWRLGYGTAELMLKDLLHLVERPTRYITGQSPCSRPKKINSQPDVQNQPMQQDPATMSLSVPFLAQSNLLVVFTTVLLVLWAAFVLVARRLRANRAGMLRFV
jgi:hypothetical protein